MLSPTSVRNYVMPRAAHCIPKWATLLSSLCILFTSIAGARQLCRYKVLRSHVSTCQGYILKCGANLDFNVWLFQESNKHLISVQIRLQSFMQPERIRIHRGEATDDRSENNTYRPSAAAWWMSRTRSPMERYHSFSDLNKQTGILDSESPSKEKKVKKVISI